MCKMVYMPLVWPILSSNIKQLEAKFSHSYYTVASVFYISICNEQREERLVLVEDMDGWNDFYKGLNSLFWFTTNGKSPPKALAG